MTDRERIETGNKGAARKGRPGEVRMKKWLWDCLPWRIQRRIWFRNWEPVYSIGKMVRGWYVFRTDDKAENYWFRFKIIALIYKHSLEWAAFLDDLTYA